MLWDSSCSDMDDSILHCPLSLDMCDQIYYITLFLLTHTTGHVTGHTFFWHARACYRTQILLTYKIKDIIGPSFFLHARSSILQDQLSVDTHYSMLQNPLCLYMQDQVCYRTQFLRYAKLSTLNPTFCWHTPQSILQNLLPCMIKHIIGLAQDLYQTIFLLYGNRYHHKLQSYDSISLILTAPNQWTLGLNNNVQLKWFHPESRCSYRELGSRKHTDQNIKSNTV